VRRDGGNGGIDWAAPGYVVGGIGTILVAALLVPFRGAIATANLALIMVIVVVLAAAVGGRGAGAVGAVVAALSFDFFLTQPYLSMKIESADDVETTLLLLVIGLVVGEIVVLARRNRRSAHRGSDVIARVHRIAELVAAGAPIDEVVHESERELVGLLALRDCIFEPVPVTRPLPRLERNGAVSGVAHRHHTPTGLALPAETELPVMGRGRQLGRFVLVADARVGLTLEDRAVAVVISDQLGAAMAADGRRVEADERRPRG